jgi:hypothetical protein
MNARKMYFDLLLFDAIDSAVDVDLGEDPIIIAALILSDSINGLRKALLQAASTKTAEAV